MALPPMLVEVVGILEDSPFAAENEIAFTIDTWQPSSMHRQHNQRLSSQQEEEVGRPRGDQVAGLLYTLLFCAPEQSHAKK